MTEPTNGTTPNGHHGYPAAYGGLMDERLTAPDAAGLDIGNLFVVLWRQKVTLVLTTLVVILCGLLYIRVAVREYQSASLLELSLRRPRIMGQQDAVINDVPSASASDLLNTQILKLQGNDLRNDVYRALKHPHSRAAAFLKGISDGDGLAMLGESTRIELIRRSNLVRINVLTSNPVFSATLANTYAHVAVSNVFAANKAVSEDAVKWLATQAEGQRTTLHAAEKALLDFQKVNLVETLEAQRKVGEESISAYNADLAEAVAERNAALARYTEKHPQVIALDAVIATAGKQLADETESVRGLEAKITELKATQAALERDRAAAELSYQGVLRRMEEARLSADENTATIQIVESASIPSDPVRPNVVMVLLASCVAGGVCGIFMALLSEKVSDRVWHVPEITAGLGLRWLGSVPHARRMQRASLALVSREDKFNAISESYAGIRGAIDASNMGKVFLVTSASAEEGKTVCCCNLSIASATSGIRTLLVDLDLRRPRLRHIFDLDVAGKELIQVKLLSQDDGQDFDSLVIATGIPNLSVVASRSSLHLNPSEILGSRRIKRFIEWAARNFDRVIIDSPPVSVASDAMALCASVDAVVFVCRYNKSRKNMVKACVRRLQDVGAKFAGIVINDINPRAMNYGYGHGYYGYHYKPDDSYGVGGSGSRRKRTTA